MAKAVDTGAVIKNFLADRRRDRQLRTEDHLLCDGDRRGDLHRPVSFPVGAVSVAATGVGSTVYLLIRRRDTGLPGQGPFIRVVGIPPGRRSHCRSVTAAGP
ncbi:MULTISPECIES: hypothetical protein [Streptomyces]|nr:MULTISPECIES: hypothetical protein [Streptomyces]MYT03119.1 hypothetical protein [Streptomyces sp. SID5470]